MKGKEMEKLKTKIFKVWILFCVEKPKALEANFIQIKVLH